jgi:hypothetical protein
MGATMPIYFTIDSAAEALHVSPEALRARCRRAARRKGKDIVADLADGIVAIKFGRTWRVRFPDTTVEPMVRSASRA